MPSQRTLVEPRDPRMSALLLLLFACARGSDLAGDGAASAGLGNDTGSAGETGVLTSETGVPTSETGVPTSETGMAETGSSTSETGASTEPTDTTSTTDSSDDGSSTGSSTSTESTESTETTVATETTADTGSDTSEGGSSETAGPEPCPIVQTWDFEDCQGSGWSTGLANAFSSPSTWQCGDPTAFTFGPGIDPNHTGVWGTNLSGFYNDDESSYVVSPSFSLEDCAGMSVRGTFEHWYNFEGGASNADGGVLQISIDGGATWETIFPDVEGYHLDRTLTTTHEPPNGEHGFSALDKNREWRISGFDLKAFAGNDDVALRFVFGSDAANPRGGWYIDTVTIGG